MSNRTGWSAGGDVLFLTAVGTVAQLLAFGYRVALSRMLGAEVMGLYQLLMPVYSVLLSLTAVGLAAAVSNLTSQYLAWDNRRGAAQMVRTCLGLLFLSFLPVAAAVILFSDPISVYLLGDARTQMGLVLLLPCVALTGVENVHKQHFYGAGRVRPPAVVDLLEQVVRAGAVLSLLFLYLPQYPERAVGLVVVGMAICEVFSSVTLFVLTRRWWRKIGLPGPGERGSVRRRRVRSIAFPVGVTALLGNLMGAVNAALIPQKLVEGGMARSAAMSEFGVVCGMTLPMLALPTVFLGALALVLTPKLARAAALERPEEVRRCIHKAMSVVSLLTLPSMALMVVLGPDLGKIMFHQEGVGEFLLPLAVVMALSCYESVLNSVLNGIGKQREVAAISLLSGGVQVWITLRTVALPGVGMAGYVAGAVISTLLGLGLVLWRVVHHTGLEIRLFQWLTAPGLSALLAALNANLLFRILKDAGLSVLSSGTAAMVFAVVVYLAALQAQGVRAKEGLSFY